MIQKHPKQQLYALHMKQSTCILGIYRGRFLVQHYYGKTIPLPEEGFYADFDPHRSQEIEDSPENFLMEGSDQSCNQEPCQEPQQKLEDLYMASGYLPLGFSLFGGADYRSPSLVLRDRENRPLSDLILQETQIKPGLPKLIGLPSASVSSRAENSDVGAESAADSAAETLYITFRVGGTHVYVILSFSVIPEADMLLRSTRLEHRGAEGEGVFTVDRLMSAAIPLLSDESNWELISLDGAHARERHVHRSPLRPGITSVGSTRGASSHRHNPWCALVQPETGEQSGEALGCGLVYSGDFLMESELADDGGVRISIGLHPETTRFILEPGECLDSPQAVFTRTCEGLNGLSRRFHNFIRNYLMPERWRDRERPVLLNTWEGVYFAVNEADIREIAEKSAELGMELLVMDDGWFGRRNDDTSSLGDWYVNREKLPGGLKKTADTVHKLGMLFGIWIEPEMISPESDLYRKHPDWCLHVPGQQRLRGRNQLVLDLSRNDVRRYIIDRMTEIIDGSTADYVKWDMNRYVSNAGSQMSERGNSEKGRGGEVSFRFMQGVYEIMDRITSRFPDVLFEGCAGGGGRYDLGMMPFFPQYWTSDNTDALSRLKIQYGTSMVYPPISMGAHVTDVPNHQTGRSVSLGFRSITAMAGNYGFELDPRRLSREELKILKSEICWYKEHRRLLQMGDFYRLKSPFAGQGKRVSWMTVSKDKGEAAIFLFSLYQEANQPGRFWKLAGLDPEKFYRISMLTAEGISRGSREEELLERKYSGAELMYRGIKCRALPQDHTAYRLYAAAADA